ncbi:MAG: GTP cyclohydrolase I FolE [Lachnospiraceae bacterium]|nr:GTP cyclohydrolase I FolE [Lachnospiraceae bacterium]
MVDREKIEQAVALLLEGIGEDRNREGLRETPDRIARMYEEIFAGLDQTPEKYLTRTFPVQGSGMILEKDITFYSTCEHHLLPFYGKAHIAYIPRDRVVGLSKLARTVEVYARRPQLQEQLTLQIAEALLEYLKPEGVMVMLEAEHMCMTMRGVKKPGTQTVTLAVRGAFEQNRDLQDEFWRMMGR